MTIDELHSFMEEHGFYNCRNTEPINEEYVADLVQFALIDGYNKAIDDLIDIAVKSQYADVDGKEYSHLSKGSDSSLLKRIADYFSSEYEGDDKTAPKMELSVDDLRYIASLNVEKCRLQTEINNLKKLHEEYNNGWILCSKKLPEEKINPVTENYYVYPVIYKNEDIEDIKYYHYGKGHWYNGLQIMDDYVIAWFQLPDYM